MTHIFTTTLGLVNVQSTLAISDRPFFEHLAILNKSPGHFSSIYGLVPYKLSRYLELRYLEHFAVSNNFYLLSLECI